MNLNPCKFYYTTQCCVGYVRIDSRGVKVAQCTYHIRVIYGVPITEGNKQTRRGG